MILQGGADINVQDSDGWTALWHAYSSGSEDLVCLLLKSGADKNIPNADGEMLLQEAISNEDEDLVEILQKFH